MKRHTIVLCALMFVCSLASAQSYPPLLAGDQVVTDEIDVGATLISVWNVPWSIPNVNDDYVWFGTVEATPDVLTLRLFAIFTTDTLRYVGPAARDLRNGLVLPWDEDAGCYILLTPDENNPTTLMHFYAVTIGESSSFYEGHLVFTGHPPQWWEISPEHGFYQYDVFLFDWGSLRFPEPTIEHVR